MKPCFFFTMAILFSCWLSAFALGPDELPFGAVHSPGVYNEDMLNTLDALSFNYFADFDDNFTSTYITALNQHGMEAVRGGHPGGYHGWEPEAPYRYSWANYAAIDVGWPYANKEVRMVAFGGHTLSDRWVSDSGSVNILRGISTYDQVFYDTLYDDGLLKNRVAFANRIFFNYFNSEYIYYNLRIRCAINNPESSDDSVAIVRVKFGPSRDDIDPPYSIYTDSTLTWKIRLNDFNSEEMTDIEVGSFYIPNEIWYKSNINADSIKFAPNCDTCRYIPYLELEIETTSLRQFSVDSITIYDNPGKDLVELSQNDGDIRGKFADFVNDGDRIFGWNLMDEPLYANLKPFQHIKSIMDSVNTANDLDWKIFTYNWQYNPHETITRSYLNIVGDNYVFPDIYTIFDNGHYTGSCYQQQGICWPDGAMYMWDRNLSWVREEIDDAGIDSSAFWIAIQAHEDYSGPNPYRMPKPSELSCQTYMALAWGARAINYYFYHWPNFNDGVDNGILTAEGDTTALYNKIAADIGPYIQAVDEFYMPLKWDSCYVFTPTTVAPSGCIIHSITATSDSENPDGGWFEVGQFSDTLAGDTSYVLVVNRACNLENGSSAPNITATIRLDPSLLGFDKCAYIVDLADTTIFNESKGKYEGIPDSIYSIKMEDGKIPFTTTLRAGEGKLFKIFQAPEIRLMGNLNSNYTYQGSQTIVGDLTVPATKVFKIKGPALIGANRCDSLNSGVAPGLVEIRLNGAINAQGTATDSIYFSPLISDESCPDLERNYPIAGDWYGIIDYSADYDTLLYCSIKYPYQAYRASTNSHALIRHCNINHCENVGVYLTSCNSSFAIIDSSRLTYCGNYGIYGAQSLFNARDNYLSNVSTNCIYITKKPTGIIAQHEIDGNTIVGVPVGIYVQGFSTSKPAVLFKNNSVTQCGQAGIHLYRTETGAWGMANGGVQFTGGNSIDDNLIYGLRCQFSSPAIFTSSDSCAKGNSFSYNNNYGICCTDSSSPKIQQAFFDSNSTSNVMCTGSSFPNLGQGTTVWGLNCFSTVSYDIYNTSGGSPIWAEHNFWGEPNNPDLSDFYPNSRVLDYTPHEPSCPCASYPTFNRLAYSGNLPKEFSLYQNYPNPFNPSTTIAFDLPQDSWVRINVYNVLGQKVRAVVNSQYAAGSHEVIWDGRNDSGGEVSSGVYFYLLETDNFRDAKKMLMIR